jgi:acetolactate synthase-1/3 small subunit
MGAKIADISLRTMTIELSDTPERVSLLEELLAPFSIQEVARTGTIALQSGAEASGFNLE